MYVSKRLLRHECSSLLRHLLVLEALLLLLGSLVARPEKSVGDLPGEVLALYRGSRAAAAAITAGATAASRAAGAARRELQGDPSNET